MERNCIRRTAAILSAKAELIGISGLVVEYIVAIDVTRVRFPADALRLFAINVQNNKEHS